MVDWTDHTQNFQRVSRALDSVLEAKTHSTDPGSGRRDSSGRWCSARVRFSRVWACRTSGVLESKFAVVCARVIFVAREGQSAIDLVRQRESTN
jgi:hypothetical protein